jgi:hypothetical protein
MGIENDAGEMPLDYLVNGTQYLSSLGGTSDGGTSEIAYSDYVTFSNWSKQ